MAQKKATITEIVINILFWAAMTLSVFGLFIYGAYQIYLKTQDKPLHYFRLGSKKTKTKMKHSEEASEHSSNTIEPKSEEKEPEESVKSHEKPGRPSALALDYEYIDQEMKMVVQTYQRRLSSPNNYTKWLMFDYTPVRFGLHKLMSESNPEAFKELMTKRGNFIMRILQNKFGDMTWNFNPSRPAAQGHWYEIIISSEIPQKLIDYYINLPKDPLYTWYPDELLQKIIDFSAQPKDQDQNLVINLEPKELAGNTYYVYLNSFVEETKNPAFKKQAFAVLIEELEKHLANKYKIQLNYDEGNDQYFIPHDQRWQLESGANLSALNPPFSALAAKREAERAKTAGDKKELEKSSADITEDTEEAKDSESRSFRSK